MKPIIVALSAMLLVAACASTRSTVLPERAGEAPKIAVVPLKGDYGSEATDPVTQEFAKLGIAVLVGPSVISIVGYDADFTDATPRAAGLLQRYAQRLDADFVLTGTVDAVGGPLYPFDQVKMTLRLIDVQTGQTRWIGNYGNSPWTSAVSTQGDIARGARQLAREFDESGAGDLVRQADMIPTGPELVRQSTEPSALN